MPNQFYVPFRVDESLLDTPAMIERSPEVSAARDVIVAKAKERTDRTYVDLPAPGGCHSWFATHDGVPMRGIVQYALYLPDGSGPGWIGRLDVAWK
jgi:hypothetical protein